MNKRSRAAVRRFDGPLKLVNFDFAHRLYSTEMAAATLPGDYPATRPDPLRFFRAVFPHGASPSPQRCWIKAGSQPACGFRGIVPTAIVYAAPEFTWGMSVQSTSADCQIPVRRGSQARSLSEERPKRARF
jgi:hypothetical protein